MIGRRLVAVALTAAWTHATALAADVSISSFFSQRFDANLRESDGSSSTDIGAVIATSTPRLNFSFAPGVSALLDSDADFDAADVTPRFNLSASYLSGLTTLSASASAVPRLTNATQFEPIEDGDGSLIRPEFSDEDAVELDLTARLGVSRQLTTLTSGTLDFTANARRFISGGEGSEETENIGVSAGLSRTLTALTSANLTASQRRFFDDEGERDVTQMTLGLSGQLAPLLNYGFNFGGNLSDGDFGFAGGANLSASGPRASASLSFSQDVDQDDDGALETRTSLAGGFSYRLTQSVDLSLNATLSQRTPFADDSGDDATDLSLGASVSTALSREWRINAGYTTRTQINGDDDDDAAVFVTLSRNLQLLP